MKTVLTLIVLCYSLIAQGQTDTTSIQLPQDVLGLEDIRITEAEIANNQVFTASSTISNADELPYSVYVVTGEEILRNGYFTLTDVLKSVPGIFVSQPGSAVEGETFMMNGMHGNTHAKILINNVPLKTNNVQSMPIGAQLPIRQAERIEITYGPSGIIHGTEAGAGVINIITRTSERPVYTHADLGLGLKGHSSVNVLFGGKLGKNKRILKFSAYGSSTEKNSLNIDKFNTDVFFPATYPLNSFIEPPNNVSALNVFPHTSRQVGVNLKYRSFTLAASRMSRKDHSALGSNPLAVDYSNPTTTYGEQISTINFRAKRDFKRIGLNFSAYFVSYEVDRESSFEFIQPNLKQLYNFAADFAAAGDIAKREEYLATTNKLLFDGRRYVAHKDANSKFEQTISFFMFNKNLELIAGANLDLTFGDRYREYLTAPRDLDLNEQNGNANFFAIGYLTLNKLNVIVGLNRYINQSISSRSEVPTYKKTLPRFAALYKINSRLNVHASYASSFVVPANYLSFKGGEIGVQIGEAPLEPPTQGRNPLPVPENNLQPQETTYSEIGLRCRLDSKIRLSLMAFKSSNTNLIYYQQNIQSFPNITFIEYGYINHTNHNSNLMGLRASAEFKKIFGSRELNFKIHYSYFNGEQDLPSGEKFQNVIAQPNTILQSNLSFRLYKKLFINIEGAYIGSYASRRLESIKQFETEDQWYKSRPNFFLDIALNLRLNKNFNMFAKWGNILGYQNTGIDATGSPDDLNVNLQVHDFAQVGLSYTIN